MRNEQPRDLTVIAEDPDEVRESMLHDTSNAKNVSDMTPVYSWKE